MTERHTHTHTHTLSESHHTFPAGHFTRRSATSFKKQRLNKIFNCGESGREWSGPDWTQTADITPRAETKFNVAQQLSNCCWRASTLDLILTNTPWAGDACLGAWGVPSTPRLSVQTSRNFHSNLTICPVWEARPSDQSGTRYWSRDVMTRHVTVHGAYWRDLPGLQSHP